MDAVFGTLLIRFFMIVCSLILITRTISGHMYELSLQWMAGTNEQSGRSIHTQIHSWENITGVIYKTLVWENETTFGVFRFNRILQKGKQAIFSAVALYGTVTHNSTLGNKYLWWFISFQSGAQCHILLIDVYQNSEKVTLETLK